MHIDSDNTTLAGPTCEKRRTRQKRQHCLVDTGHVTDETCDESRVNLCYCCYRTIDVAYGQRRDTRAKRFIQITLTLVTTTRE